jgi:hypothetical protein
MKKISFSFFMVLLVSVMTLTSCDAGKVNEKAEATGNRFYTFLQQKNYDSALTLCSDKAFQTEGNDAWIKSFKRNAGLLGGLVSFTKTSGMNINVATTSGTTTAVTYDVQWEFGQSKDSLLFVKDKGGEVKIYRYSWQHSNTKYMSGMDESEKQAEQYMNAIQNENYPAALDLCAEEAFKLSPKQQWIVFYENSAQKLGKLEKFKVLADSSTYAIAGTGQIGKGNYYDVLVDVSRPSGTAKEKLVFFQKQYNEPLKLAGHFFL